MKALLPRALGWWLLIVMVVAASVLAPVFVSQRVEAQPSRSAERARTQALEGIHGELTRIRRLMESRDRRERGE